MLTDEQFYRFRRTQLGSGSIFLPQMRAFEMATGNLNLDGSGDLRLNTPGNISNACKSPCTDGGSYNIQVSGLNNCLCGTDGFWAIPSQAGSYTLKPLGSLSWAYTGPTNIVMTSPCISPTLSATGYLQILCGLSCGATPFWSLSARFIGSLPDLPITLIVGAVVGGSPAQAGAIDNGLAVGSASSQSVINGTFCSYKTFPNPQIIGFLNGDTNVITIP